jgi:hypothetical protein
LVCCRIKIFKIETITFSQTFNHYADFLYFHLLQSFDDAYHITWWQVTTQMTYFMLPITYLLEFGAPKFTLQLECICVHKHFLTNIFFLGAILPFYLTSWIHVRFHVTLLIIPHTTSVHMLTKLTWLKNPLSIYFPLDVHAPLVTLLIPIFKIGNISFHIYKYNFRFWACFPY